MQGSMCHLDYPHLRRSDAPPGSNALHLQSSCWLQSQLAPPSIGPVRAVRFFRVWLSPEKRKDYSALLSLQDPVTFARENCLGLYCLNRAPAVGVIRRVRMARR